MPGSGGGEVPGGGGGGALFGRCGAGRVGRKDGFSTGFFGTEGFAGEAGVSLDDGSAFDGGVVSSVSSASTAGLLPLVEKVWGKRDIGRDVEDERDLSSMSWTHNIFLTKRINGCAK